MTYRESVTRHDSNDLTRPHTVAAENGD